MNPRFASAQVFGARLWSESWQASVPIRLVLLTE